MDVLVTYDIADTDGAGARRLREVARICEGYGVRAQFSVFECRISSERLAALTLALDETIDPKRDSINFYVLGNSFGVARKTLGRLKHHTPGEPWVF